MDLANPWVWLAALCIGGSLLGPLVRDLWM